MEAAMKAKRERTFAARRAPRRVIPAIAPVPEALVWHGG
jgi:hypothetical protein